MRYHHCLTWLKRTGTVNTADGQTKETFASNGVLWGEVEETFGRRQEEYGAEQTGRNATIRIRNRPALSALDRLSWDGRTWIIDSIHREGVYDLSCDAYSYDTLTI